MNFCFSQPRARPFHAAVVFIVRLWILCRTGVSAQDVTCDIPSTNPTGKTSLTCQFPEDVSQTRNDFSVYLYKEEGSHDAVDVLDCWWLSGKMECFVLPGYKYNMMISDKLTLEIPQASSEQVGIYTCRLGNVASKYSKPCEFRIKLDERTMCDIRSAGEKSDRSLTCYFPVDINKTRADFTVHHYSAHGVEDTVVSCKWRGDIPSCTTIRGYKFDRSVSDHLTIIIPSASEDHEGTYSCHTAGPGTVSFDNCTLTLEEETTSSCDISSVAEMEPTELICIFSLDVRVTKRNFRVLHHDGNGNKVGASVVTCLWVKDEFVCATVPGYEFNKTVTDHLVVRLPRASRKHSGNYSCQVLGSNIEGFQTCEFFVTPDGFTEEANSSPLHLTTTLSGIVLMLIPVTLIMIIVVQKRKSLKKKPEVPFEGTAMLTEEGREEACTQTGGAVESETKDDACDICLHLISSPQAALLGSQLFLDSLKQKTGADVQFDDDLFDVRGMPSVTIRGSRSKIEETLKLISKENILTQVETFWLQWVEAAFPDLDSRAYFLPPVYVNRVPMTRQDVRIIQSAPEKVSQFKRTGMASFTDTVPSSQSRFYDNDVRIDAALQRVLVSLLKMFEENREALVGLSKLLSEHWYATEVDQLPFPNSLYHALLWTWRRGMFDVILIHRHYGLIICKVKAFGENIKEMKTPQKCVDYNIRKKLTHAVSQLDKAEAMLSHLVSDIAPGLRITKTIAFPNLTTRQLQHAISGDSQLIEDLCRCLRTSNPADIPGLCLCCDQLSDPKTPCDVSSHVLRELGHWWQRRVAGVGPDSHMTFDLYKTLVARCSLSFNFLFDTKMSR
ncbi:uncharacterized protein LOC112574798 isoform X3 [Pomacea canaliculata]|nr:uncharacterized protein LOC112574798 isoform X3 [Pomacea canaliculata]